MPEAVILLLQLLLQKPGQEFNRWRVDAVADLYIHVFRAPTSKFICSDGFHPLLGHDARCYLGQKKAVAHQRVVLGLFVVHVYHGHVHGDLFAKLL